MKVQPISRIGDTEKRNERFQTSQILNSKNSRFKVTIENISFNGIICDWNSKRLIANCLGHNNSHVGLAIAI